MTVIDPVILAPAVVEEGEESHYSDVRTGSRSKQEPVAFDAPPVVGTMNAIA